MTSTTTTKRHRWPKRPPGACRNGDRCLDCGLDLGDAKRGGHACRPAPQIASPDGRELQRAWCPHCDYGIASTPWCHDPACCDQSPERFLEALLVAEATRGVPVFAVRYPDPLPPYSPEIPVRVWRAGGLTPVFAGRLADAVLFEIQHDCTTSPPKETA